jgi:hypothetical protein
MELTERGRPVFTTITDQGRLVVNTMVENSQLIIYGVTSDAPVLSGSFNVDHIALTWT